jgi:hypothetical protein
MKRAGAAILHRKMRGMTFRQKMEFWRKESEKLRHEQEAAKALKAERPAKRGK